MKPYANIPFVIESSHRGERAYDIYSRLLLDRIIVLGTAIDDEVANAVVAQLLFLNGSDKKKEDIKMYINSPGGIITAGLAIYDTMQHIECDVQTLCVGEAASMGAMLLMAGTKGKRKALPSARIMIHQASGGAYGKTTDARRTFQELEYLNNYMHQLAVKHTGQTREKINADFEKDTYMSAEEAKVYGIVDEVVV